MEAYRYNEQTKEYIGTTLCQLDPLTSQAEGHDVYLLPANATYDAPPQRDGCAAVWSEQGWSLVEDHRGEKYYPAGAAHDSSPVEMRELGPLPEGSTSTPPPLTDEELAVLLRSMRDAKLSACDFRLCSDVYNSMTLEQQTEWVEYRQSLRDLPSLEGFPWDGGGELTPWPEIPE